MLRILDYLQSQNILPSTCLSINQLTSFKDFFQETFGREFPVIQSPYMYEKVVRVSERILQQRSQCELAKRAWRLYKHRIRS